VESSVRGARVAGVSLDCEDHRELASFYARLLGGHVTWMTDTAAGVSVGNYDLVAQRVSPYARPTWPGTSIVHLDLTCEPADLPAFQEHAEQCGAEVAPHQPDERWVVLLDPAGHPFCLTPIA
jgi:catechol-2,3-dioxygenase